MLRRTFLETAALGVMAFAGGCAHGAVAAAPDTQRLFFTSSGKTCVINADGSGFRALDFNAPGQVTWQPAGFFPDGRVLLLSMEARRDGPGRPFEEYYHQTPTHLWIHDPDGGSLAEIADKERMAPFYTPQLPLRDNRILVQVVREKPGQIFNMNLDGTDARAFTGPGEGLPYGLSLSPDGNRVAFHLAGPDGYQVWTSDTNGGDRKLLAAHPDFLYFGTSWSPDGQWVAYQACRYRDDPGHDWADLCVGRPDGSEHRVLTENQALWFGATYGNPERRGGGSNIPVWTHDGAVLCSRRLPGSRVAWAYQAGRPDLDHFNREFQPETARGGAEICTIHPDTGAVARLTRSEPPVWDFRACESPDGRLIAFCRCATGEQPALWVMNADGGGQRLLSAELDNTGADHPRWVPRAE
ncbi:MAG: serine/threonine protein kinase [Candidatus Hydrogenedens sp.]|nr:PD40 domain-containing protein [Candidatus Hydrogenedentota bacterium]NLF58582.1 serine/threonine protein kinase [Candidatus Hydrogenedens sp.]